MAAHCGHPFFFASRVQNRPSCTRIVVSAASRVQNRPSCTRTVVSAASRVRNRPSCTRTVVSAASRVRNRPFCTRTVVPASFRVRNRPFHPRPSAGTVLRVVASLPLPLRFASGPLPLQAAGGNTLPDSTCRWPLPKGTWDQSIIGGRRPTEGIAAQRRKGNLPLLPWGCRGIGGDCIRSLASRQAHWNLMRLRRPRSAALRAAMKR